MEFTVDVESGHVLLDVEFVSHVGGVENEVEGIGPGLRPVLVACANELLGAELEGVVLLVGAVREGVDFSTERRCPEQSEMTQSTSRKLVNHWEKAGKRGRRILTSREWQPSFQVQLLRVPEGSTRSDLHTS